MQAAFWHERWQKSETGFHLDRVNPLLEKHFSRLELASGDRVLVPLCGASHDLPWLVSQGLEVVGVELSEIAVQQIFDAHKLSAQREALVGDDGGDRGLVRWHCDGLTIFQGDIFALQPGDVGDVAAVYDRAALIALPPPLREQYVQHLMTLAGAARRTLLITLEYDPAVMSGPPFPVVESDVQRYFSSDFDITQLSNADILDKSPRFREKGHSWMREPIYLMTPTTPARHS